MSKKYDYDLMVIGGGAGGLSVTSAAAQLGVKVLLIDNKPLGGDCLHYGCVPSKSLIKTAKICHEFRNASKYGLKDTDPEFDFSHITQRISDIQDIIAVHDSEDRFRSLGADVIFGKATFKDSHTIQVSLNPDLLDSQQEEFIRSDRVLEFRAKKIVVATGSVPNVPQINGLDDVGYITNEDVFSLKKRPESLLVIGGGPIGCEMGQAYARLGTKVSILIRGGHILDREDEDVSSVVEKQFLDEGIHILKNTQVHAFEMQGDKKVLHFDQEMASQSLRVDEVLVATGRIPNTDLDLEKAGIQYTSKGITTDKKLRTNKKHIYAIGDVNGKYLFTHAANYEAGVVVRNAIFHLPAKVNYDVIPWTTFTDPEVASCGLNEKRAKEQNIAYDIILYPFEKHDRALAESENKGFIKILTKGKRGKILGVQIVGPHAGELIHECILAYNSGLKLSKITSSVHVYPTLAEIVKIASGKFFAPKLFSPFVKKVLRFFFRYKGRK